MLLSKRLKELRISNGLTQKEFGECVNVTKVSICCYENGTRVPTLETLTKLGEALGVDVDYLLGNDNQVAIKGNKQKKVIMSNEEIEFIKGLRKMESLYQLVTKNPSKALEIISKNLEK